MFGTQITVGRIGSVKKGIFQICQLGGLFLILTIKNEVLLATEIGVWSTETFLSNDPEWGSSNSGLANVRVDMLKFRSSDKHIAVATHGRGLFSTDHYVVPIPPNNAPVAQSINGQIDEDSSFQSYFIGDDEDDDAITISILTEPSDGIVSIGNNVYYDISYYDEQFESGIGCGAACSFGVRFTPASYPALLTSVLVSINSAGTESNATLLAYLDPSGDASGPEGDHITLAVGVDLSANNEFHQVSILLDEEVLIESGDIYVVVKENGGFRVLQMTILLAVFLLIEHGFQQIIFGGIMHRFYHLLVLTRQILVSV